MDYLKVALRTDLAAEDTSQAAPRAIVHLIGALSRETFCGKAAVRDVTHAGSDRVVSCGDCLSLSRTMRESPADNTSLLENVSRILRHVSGPDYSGIERRSRPRFIHHAVPTTGEEAMKHYTNVLRADETTIHVMFDGDIATACGAISAPELTPAPQGKAVSCDACMKAILNRQRASDHRMPLVPGEAAKPVLHHNFSTHQAAWRNAIVECITVSRRENSHGEETYWKHELKAFDLAYGTFDHSLATGGDDMASINPVVSVDAVVEANRKLLLDRSTLGIRKYGVTLEKSGLSQREIVQHAIEEALDLANYLQTFLQHPAAQ